MTSLYIIITLILSVSAGYYFFSKRNSLNWAMGSSFAIIIFAYVSYEMFFENIFVRNFGGTMTVSVPDGEFFVDQTWKDGDYWMTTYNPEKNECYFREDPRFSILKGKVVVKNCKIYVP